MATPRQYWRAGYATRSWTRFEPCLPAAGAVVFDIPASSDLSAWRVVRLNVAGTGVEYAQPVDDVVVLGITITAAGAGEDVTLVRTGTYSDPSWNWSPGVSIILGNDGVLTQTLPPGAQVNQPVGLAIAPTRMLVRIDANTQIF